jgi:hypothetical protein
MFDSRIEAIHIAVSRIDHTFQHRLGGFNVWFTIVVVVLIMVGSGIDD